MSTMKNESRSNLGIKNNLMHANNHFGSQRYITEKGASQNYHVGSKDMH